jgi:uncharacterized repeat protein (TIGR01451 family)
LTLPAWAQTADLSITKTDGSATSVPGTGIVYTIQVMNAGPDADPAAVVTDTFPAALLGVTWTCSASVGSSCTPAGGGNIADVVNILAGGVLTYTVNATIDPAATGMLSNTATVTPSGGVTDPNGSDNLSIDTNTLTPQADLAISKTDGQATDVPGTSITYTIVVSNVGPSNAPGATVSDTFPGSLIGVTWSCSATPGSSCTAGGSGNIADVVTLLAGGSATYTVNATISPSATGILSNTATVTAPGGVTETAPLNNTSTDNTTLTPQADLAVTKTDGVASVTAGTSLVYTIVVTNAGPSNAPNATVTDNFPASLTGVTWTCAPAGGASCTLGGTGNINQVVNLPAGGSLTYTVNATVDPCATGSVSNTVTVAPGMGVTDPGPGLNSATDTDTINSSADLSLSVVDSPDPVLVCNTLTYVLTITNNGPSCATAVTLQNILPPGVSFSSSVPGSPTCVDTLGTQNCSLGTILPGNMTSVTVVGIVDFSLKGSTVLDNATVSSATFDPTPVNDTFVTATDVKPKDPYVVTLSGAPRFLRIGVVTKVDYLLRVTSLCLPSLSTTNVIVTSELPPGLEFVQSIPAPTTQVDNTLTFEYPVFAGDTIEQVVMQAKLVDGTPAGTELKHTVSLIDDLSQVGSDSFSIGVRALGASVGKLKLRMVAPRRVQAGALLKTRISIDHTSLDPATNVELQVTTPEEAELVSAVPPPSNVESIGGQLLLEWSFLKIPRKQVIRLTQRVDRDIDQGAILSIDGSVSDDSDRSASASRQVQIRGQVRATPTPRR